MKYLVISADVAQFERFRQHHKLARNDVRHIRMPFDLKGYQGIPLILLDSWTIFRTTKSCLRMKEEIAIYKGKNKAKIIHHLSEDDSLEAVTLEAVTWVS